MNIASYASTVCASLRYLRTPRQGQAHTLSSATTSLSHIRPLYPNKMEAVQIHMCVRERKREREPKLVASPEVGSIRPPDQLLVDEKTDFS